MIWPRRCTHLMVYTWLQALLPSAPVTQHIFAGCWTGGSTLERLRLRVHEGNMSEPPGVVAPLPTWTDSLFGTVTPGPIMIPY